MSRPRISYTGAEVKPSWWNESYQGFKLQVVTENLKIQGLIYNMQSAHGCYSRACGYCQLENPDDCYAFCTERYIPLYEKKNDKQEKLWDALDAETIGNMFISMLGKGKRIEKLRQIAKDTLGFIRIRPNEAGEIKSQAHLIKLNRVNEIIINFLRANSIRAIAAGYTANPELDLSVLTHLVLKGSGKDLGHGECRVIPDAQSCPKGFFLCRKDCRKCAACAVKGVNVAIPLH